MANNVEHIKDRLSIEEVVGQYVELKPAGTNLKAKCPFHAEKTPSFMVSPSRQTYHCFGCGVGGDMFTFIENIEGLDFKGALKMLADRAGVELTYDRDETKSDTDVLFSILESATAFYEHSLAKHDEARAYLHERGLTDETVRAFRIGFAPASWDAAQAHLREQGFREADIARAGLIKERQTQSSTRGYYDRFRSRILFPITDSVGRVVAFSGRAFGDTDESMVGGAKYVNSPETELYHKSKILYGYDRARQTIRKTNFAILVEGQMDLVASHQSGYTNAVAISGTALTPEHVRLLSRMSTNVVMALDADEAGVASASKSAKVALQAGFDVKVAALPEGDDPASMIARGDVVQWKQVIKNAKHVIDFLLDYWRVQTKDDRAFKLAVTKEVLPYLHSMQSAVDKTHFIQRIATQLAVTEDVIQQELARIPENQQFHEKRTTAPLDDTKQQQHMHAEEELVLMYLWQQQVEEPIIDLEGFRKQVEGVLTPVGFQAYVDKFKDNKEAAFRFESLYDSEDTIKSAISELLERLTHVRIRKELDEATTKLRKAEADGDTEKIMKLEKTCSELHQKLARL